MRHRRWFKWKTHHRMCTTCGAIKVNVEKGASNYLTEYQMPDGSVISVPTTTPPCVVGPLTQQRLADLHNFISKHPSAAAVQGIELAGETTERSVGGSVVAGITQPTTTNSELLRSS